MAGVRPIEEYNYSNEYRTISNPHYWQNRLPFEGYWQQDVHYVIDAKISDQEESITGKESLYYVNNSPDTLRRVYFHLYQNAFTPNSYAHELRKAGKLKTVFGEHEAKGAGTRINGFKINGQVATDWTIDNTILIVELQKPLLPNEQLVFDIDFITYWDKDDGGNMRRRMKSFEHSGVTHFDGVHWYPRISVYDRKFGWTTDQHLGKEFYGDFGLFEVNLSFPNQYIVEATGELLNREEVLPKELREAIDISNYKTERSVLTTPVVADGSIKTWKYKAMNVHDFAFTADPTYRIGEVFVDGIRCVAIAQEQNAHKWQKTAKFVSEVVAIYSKDFGSYIYPKMVAADARDGMEYPMLTLNSGNWPGHQYVIAHEVGHNWFFGMLGNNETYRSSLDEGFTQFLTAWSLKHINHQNTDGNMVDKQVVFNRYLSHANTSNNATLNVHADHYNSSERHGGGYGQVYFKTASMLYNLQYVLGDELFQDAMKHYVGQWKVCHPYWEDFKNSIIHYTKVDLNWFFDQWITTTKTIDYKVGSIKKKDNLYQIKLKRKGDMQMPLDVQVTFKDGSSEMHYIPNTYFVKKTDAQVHSRWIGWDQIHTSYQLQFSSEKKIDKVTIDPSERLADVNKLNNSSKFPLSARYSNYRQPYGSFDQYQLTWQPDIWYNAVDGIKAGIKAQGNYAGTEHVTSLALWYNTKVGARSDEESKAAISYALSYSDFLNLRNHLQVESKWLDGLNHQSIQWSRPRNNNRFYITFQSLYRNGNHSLDYLLQRENWNPNQWNNFVNIGINRPYRTLNSRGTLKVETRASALFSDYNYAYLQSEWKNTRAIKKLQLKSRVFAQYMSGAAAPESQLQLAGANAEQLMASAFLRSKGFVPESWESSGVDFGHWHQGGGLNIRAFSGYQATNSSDQDTFYVFAGNSGASASLELDFGSYVNPFKGKLGSTLKFNSYLFTDLGVLFNESGNSGLRADAGLGTSLTINFRPYTQLKPLTLRFDMPFFVNRIPAGQENYFAFRYVIGVSRAF